MVLRFHTGCLFGLLELVHHLLSTRWIFLNLLVEGLFSQHSSCIYFHSMDNRCKIYNWQLISIWIHIVFGSVLSWKQDHIGPNILLFLSILQIYYVLTLKRVSIYVQSSLFTGLVLMSGFVFLRYKISSQ